MFRRASSRSLAAAFLFAAACRAQSSTTTSADDGGYTLHAYANRIQIPTLVLDKNGWLVSGLPTGAFKIRLDEGPAFAPTLARIERSDPIAFALVLEAGGDQKTLLDNTTAALDSLPPDVAFTAQDHIAVYAVHCTFLRALNYAPADGKALSTAITALLASPELHRQDPTHDCGSYLPLYDALLDAGHDLAKVPGRRVMLAIADTTNANGSSAHRIDVARFFSANSIALFTLRLCPCLQHVPNLSLQSNDRVDPLEQLAIDTGGKVWNIGAGEQKQTLADFLKAVRGRYILEFPRPDSFSSGMHTISVSVRHLSDGLIRPSGVTAAVADPTLQHDPTTVPASSSPAVMGNRRPLSNTR